MAVNNGLILSSDNPFKGDVEQFRKAMKESSRTTNTLGGYKKTKITVIEQTEYFPGAFTKLYQNKYLLGDLSPDACKIVVHIALYLDFNEEKMNLNSETVGLERRRLNRALLELLGKRIICKAKPHWYWINVTLLIVGTINKHNQDENLRS